jgi:hypothetical protein
MEVEVRPRPGHLGAHQPVGPLARIEQRSWCFAAPLQHEGSVSQDEAARVLDEEQPTRGPVLGARLVMAAPRMSGPGRTWLARRQLVPRRPPP